MSFQLPPNPTPAPVKTYVSLPPEIDNAPAGFFSAKFVIIAILVIGGLTLAGLIQSGKISLSRSSGAPNSPAQTPSVFSWITNSLSAAKAASAANTARVAEENPKATAVPAPKAVPATPVRPFNPNAFFTVTSISIGQPSFAIINGISRVVGDPVEVPGATGWKLRRIVEDSVVLQNGATQLRLPLSAPDINPLNDKLHPLN